MEKNNVSMENYIVNKSNRKKSNRDIKIEIEPNREVPDSLQLY